MISPEHHPALNALLYTALNKSAKQIYNIAEGYLCFLKFAKSNNVFITI